MQDGGSQYGAPLEMNHFPAAGAGARAHVLGISQQQKLEIPQQQTPTLAAAPSPVPGRQPLRGVNFDELAPPEGGAFSDEGALAAGAEDGERGGVPGNRWPQEETLALLRIRSDMDAAFRDATLKGPLWEEVSRKLAQLGYNRSAKKCKEKFENVQKYYKRTKDGRAGRQDGKSYRFFRQLDALYGGSKVPATAGVGGAVDPHPPASADVSCSSARLQPAPLNAIPLNVGTAPQLSLDFSSDNSSGSDSDEQDTEEGLPGDQAKRKRKGGGEGNRGGKRKMMDFFESLTRQVMERQETMQNKFLEMIEKREQDRMIREEAWRRQEMARLAREHEAMAQERAMSATRDATILTFLQKMTGHTIPLPTAIAAAVAPTLAPPHQPTTASASTPLPAKRQSIHPSGSETTGRGQPPPPDAAALQLETQDAADPASSRWPKSEVHALISLRSGMETKYQEAGPKAPLWEDIAAGMRRMGYNRSAKRCKEKWENINKYFKKVKDSKKKRPEDAKTCPYFHQLDALYRRKNAAAGSSSSDQYRSKMEQNKPSFSPAPPPASTQFESDLQRDNDNESEAHRAPPVAGGSATKPEDILRDLMDQQARREPEEDSDKLEETDSDGVEQVDDDDDEDDDKGKMAYKIQYQQRPVVNGTSGGGEGQSAAAAAAAAAAVGSFMAMVQ